LLCVGIHFGESKILDIASSFIATMFIGENIDVDLVHESFATNVNGILASERVTGL
jgi:hypothetical protein